MAAPWFHPWAWGPHQVIVGMVGMKKPMPVTGDMKL